MSDAKSMRLVMMGTGTFAEPTFEAIIKAFPGQVVGLVTQPERGTGRKGASSRQVGKGMAMIASENQIRCIQPESINTPEGLDLLRGLKPDLLVVAAYGQILKPAVIDCGQSGAINVHASLLPKYRGAAPVAHAILNGEHETGVTIIRITPGLDAGEMLAQEKLAIQKHETAGELEFRIAPIGADLAVDVIRKMQKGPIQGEKQDSKQVVKAPKLTKEMGEINWNQTYELLCRQVYSMQPWPSAYTFFHRKGKPAMRLSINKLGEPSQISASPIFQTGERVQVKGLFVQISEGESVEISELQPAGKKRMTGEEFSRGYQPMPGDRFGTEA